jgi:NTP pyrophosphatase (non-canonical NTP hydrolase)
VKPGAVEIVLKVRDEASRELRHATLAMLRHQIFNEISNERERQDQLHGDHSAVWLPTGDALSVLVEEVGEVARAVIEKDPAQLRAELIQTAAVSLAMLEGLYLRRLTESDQVLAHAAREGL